MVVPVSKGQASRDSGTTSLVVASFTPAANAFMLALVSAVGEPDSLTGHDAGNSWVKIALSRTTGSGATISLWGAHAGASPLASTLTVAKSADAAMGVMLSEVPDINVSGSVANSLLDNNGNTGSGTTLSTPALSATSDLTMGFFVNANAETITPENTHLDSQTFLAGNAKALEDYNETGDTTHTATIGSSATWAAIAISFKLAAVGGSTGKSNPLMGCLGGCLSGVIA